MARTIYYKILDNQRNAVSDEEWEEVSRLQHWYNSEFIWTAGRLAMKMYAVFPNWEKYNGDTKKLAQNIAREKRMLRKKGLTENAIVEYLAREGYVFAKKGGYTDNCLASGFTKVAGNEFNAYLVCEFLLKASLIARRAEFSVYDEGNFIKPHRIFIENGVVRFPQESWKSMDERSTRVFSIVNPQKYDHYPKFRTSVAGFNELEEEERQEIVRDWNWLGFGENYDINGDDIQGYDLNRKVVDIRGIS